MKGLLGRASHPRSGVHRTGFPIEAFGNDDLRIGPMRKRTFSGQLTQPPLHFPQKIFLELNLHPFCPDCFLHIGTLSRREHGVSLHEGGRFPHVHKADHAEFAAKLRGRADNIRGDRRSRSLRHFYGHEPGFRDARGNRRCLRRCDRYGNAHAEDVFIFRVPVVLVDRNKAARVSERCHRGHTLERRGDYGEPEGYFRAVSPVFSALSSVKVQSVCPLYGPNPGISSKERCGPVDITR